MEKLPPTSYVRMVDVWLIFGQLIPFVEVSPIMELYNEDMERITVKVKIILPKSPNFFESLLAVDSVGCTVHIIILRTSFSIL
jgi:hypothetical protein